MTIVASAHQRSIRLVSVLRMVVGSSLATSRTAIVYTDIVGKPTGTSDTGVLDVIAGTILAAGSAVDCFCWNGWIMQLLIPLS